MTTLDPCPCCHTGRYVLVHHPDGTLPELVACTVCGVTGYVECARCLGTGELWEADSLGEWEFSAYCPCPIGRTKAHQQCAHQRVWAITVPASEVAF